MSTKIENPTGRGSSAGALAGQASESPVHYVGISGGLLGFWVLPTTLTPEQVLAFASKLRIRPEVSVEDKYVHVKCKSYRQAWRLYQALKGQTGR